MGNGSCEIRIGTSGWHYDHWMGRFYLDKLRKTKWLQHHAQHFNTVEINNTYYHLPCPTTLDLLNKLAVGFCTHDVQGRESPCAVTGDIAYIRFHGTAGRYAGSYTDEMLREWADWLKAQSRSARAVYACFNNDVQGHAVANALTVKRLMSV